VEPRGRVWHCNRRSLHSYFSECNLGDTAVLPFPVSWLGLCLSRSTGKSN
jgi:hypothetical protein